jgi:hypothetical protein
MFSEAGMELMKVVSGWGSLRKTTTPGGNRKGYL